MGLGDQLGKLPIIGAFLQPTSFEVVMRKDEPVETDPSPKRRPTLSHPCFRVRAPRHGRGSRPSSPLPGSRGSPPPSSTPHMPWTCSTDVCSPAPVPAPRPWTSGACSRTIGPDAFPRFRLLRRTQNSHARNFELKIDTKSTDTLTKVPSNGGPPSQVGNHWPSV